MGLYKTKIASGPDIGQVQILYFDGAIIPNMTANQLGRGQFFSKPPVIQQVAYANSKANIADEWDYINETEWNQFADTDWNNFS